MPESNLSTLDKFKMACILEDEFSDKEIKVLMMTVITEKESDIEEFLGILNRYRSGVYNDLLIKIMGKANVQKTLNGNSFEQKVGVVFRTLNSHDPLITKDIIRRVAEEFMKEDK